MMKKNNLKRIFAALSVTALLAQPIGMQVSAKPANALKQDAAPVVLAEDPKIPLKKDFTFALAADQSAVYDGTAKTLIAKFLPNEAGSVTLKRNGYASGPNLYGQGNHGGGRRLCRCKRA